MTGRRASSGGGLRASPLRDASPYERIYALVRLIPPGRVATYGQIAAHEGNATARMVGHAMATLPDHAADVPWQRVINSAGRVSERAEPGGALRQREKLLSEGVLFGRGTRVRLDLVAWGGPDAGWLEHHGFHPAPVPGGHRTQRRSRRTGGRP